MATAPSSGRLVPVDGMFGVVLPTVITAAQWECILEGLRARGRSFRGAEEARANLHQIAPVGIVHPAHKHWVDSLICALQLTCDFNINLRLASESKRALALALEAWGVTADPLKGGFILPSGIFLDMSDGGPLRRLEHCRIVEFFSPASHGHGVAVERWKDLGLIRWISEGRAISMRTAPTSGQHRTLRSLEHFRPDKGFHVDVYEPRFGNSNRSYPPGVSVEKIIVDITRFYATGVMGSMTPAMEFHLTDSAR